MSGAELIFMRVNVDHPSQRGREDGEKSRPYITLRTQKGSIREASLTEDELVRLIYDAASVLHILRKQPS
jgi:hypothetical protein